MDIFVDMFFLVLVLAIENRREKPSSFTFIHSFLDGTTIFKS